VISIFGKLNANQDGGLAVDALLAIGI
jgi:hypothetical protein